MKGGALARYDLRPRSATELMDAAFFVLRSDPRAVLVWFVLPWIAATQIGSLLPRPDPATFADPKVFILVILRTWFTFGVLAVPSFALQSLWAERLLGREPDARSIGARTLRRAPAVVLVSVAAMALTYAGFVMVFAPALYAALALLLPAPILAFETAGPLRALARSRRLMVGHKLRLAVPFLAPILPMVPVGFLPIGLARRLVGAVVLALVLAYYAAFALVVYLDLRSRKEAFDLDVLAARVEAGGT